MRRILASVLVALLLGGCSLGPWSRDEYDDRLETWQAQGVASYVWTLELSEPVFGPRRTTVRVVDGRPVRAVANGERVAIEGATANNMPATVEELVAYLARSVEDVRSVEVRWDEAGYPAKIVLDHSDAIDDEVTFTVISLEPR
jgi:hypothetical protein